MQVEIFDLDSTLWMPANTPLCVSEERLTHPMWAKQPQDYGLLPGVAEAITHLHPQNATILVCTNQGGLPWNVDQGQKCAQKGKLFRPYKTWNHFQQEILHLRSLLPQVNGVWCSPGAKTGTILVGSPDHWQFRLLPGVECHKPEPTMLLEIWRHYAGASFRFWGDLLSDKQAAISTQKAGMPIQFEWAHSLSQSTVKNYSATSHISLADSGSLISVQESP